MESPETKLAESKVAKPLAFPKITPPLGQCWSMLLGKGQWRDLGLCNPAAQET